MCISSLAPSAHIQQISRLNRSWASSTPAGVPGRFLTDLVTACERSGASCGVYSSAHMWSGIFGADFVHANYLPMWYASYDNQANLNNWAPFGGWAKPYAKKYGGDPLCGITVDVNVSPNFAA